MQQAGFAANIRDGGDNMPKTSCPNCDAEVNIAKPKLGAFVSCRDCGTELEVISVNPLELDFPLDSYDDDEDWDYEEDEDE
jgi:alpha-aminoadipate carrier protein LysW